MRNKKQIFYSCIIASAIPTLAAILLLHPDMIIGAAIILAAMIAMATGVIIVSTSEKTRESSLLKLNDHIEAQNNARILLRPAIQFIEELGEKQNSQSYMETSKRALYAEINNLMQQLNWLSTERKHSHVTVLMADLRGFTTVSEAYSANEVVDLLNRYFSHMSRVIYKYGGIVDKMVGDSIMAVFGIPESEENHALNAACCAVEMQMVMNTFNQENRLLGMPSLFMGIGINTGNVVASKLGSDLFSEYTVIGNDVNLAARIESSAVRGQILISHSTYELIQNHVEVHELMEVLVKGRKSALRIYDLFRIKQPHYLTVPEREIRRSPRANVNIPFKFHVCEGKIIFSEEHRGEITNISIGGMMIKTDKEIEPYFFIRFTLDHSVIGIDCSDIYGKILKVTKQDGMYILHIEFTIIDPKDRAAIQELVDVTNNGIYQRK